jgi:hypothetical protein
MDHTDRHVDSLERRAIMAERALAAAEAALATEVAASARSAAAEAMATRGWEEAEAVAGDTTLLDAEVRHPKTLNPKP